MSSETEEQERRLRKIRGLLAKAENAGTPEEAEAFSAKAEELIAKYAIDLATIKATGGQTREKPVQMRVKCEKNYKMPKATLLHGIAKAFDVAMIIVDNKVQVLVGFPSDLAAVDLLFTSLLLQSANAMRHESEATGLRGTDLWRWRQSFLYGFAATVRERLAATRKRTTEQAGTGTDLVLRDRRAMVHDEFKRMFPRTRSTRSRIHDYAGMTAGNAAGRRASLGGASVGATSHGRRISA